MESFTASDRLLISLEISFKEPSDVVVDDCSVDVEEVVVIVVDDSCEDKLEDFVTVSVVDSRTSVSKIDISISKEKGSILRNIQTQVFKIILS